MKLLTKILLAAVLCILPISAYSVPSNSGAGSSKSSGNRNLITNTVTLKADPGTCQAPCTVDYTITVHGTDIGRGVWYMICDNGTTSDITEDVYLNHTGLLSAEYVFADVCEYTVAGTYGPSIIGVYQPGLAYATTSVVITEVGGSIDVDLTYDQDSRVEPTDIDLTATVIGESGNVTCDFWCSCEDALGDPTTPPCNNPADDPALVGATPLTSTMCSDANNKPTAVGYEEGEYIPAVSCTRNGVGPVTAFNEVIVAPQAIAVSLEADPNYQGSSPLDNVDLIATVNDNCSEDTLELDFECVDGGGIDYAINATTIRNYSIVDQGNGDCDGYTDAPPPGDPNATDYTACVTAACTNGFAAGLSTAAESCTTISVNAAATPATFVANAMMSPTNIVDEGYTGLNVVLQLSGTATGAVSNIDVDCGAGGGWEGFGSNSIADPSACEGVDEDLCTGTCCSLITETGFTGCDYATDAGSPFTVDITADREGVTATSSAVVTVNNVPDPAVLSTIPTPYPYTTPLQVTKGTNPATQTITILNTGGSNLIWSDFDSETGAGMSCDTIDGATGAPDGSTIAAGASDELYCTFTTSALDEGTYYASVFISDNGSPNGVSPVYVFLRYAIEVIVPSDNVVAHINASRGVTTAPYEEYSPNGGRDACTAPCAVFFDGLNSTITGLDSDEVFLLGDFFWEFGDDPTDYWETGALANTSTPQSKNIEYGPTAGHLFEDPGTYYVKMTLCTSDGSSCDYDIKTISVANPDTVFGAGKTHCISATADHTGCTFPGAVTHSNVVGANAFNTAWNTHCGANGPNANVRCLFHAGQTFAANAAVDMYSSSGVQIGAYGTGTNPVITHSTAYLFLDHTGWQDWTFYDLTIDGGTSHTFNLDSPQTMFAQLSLININITNFDSMFVEAGRNGAVDGSQDLGGFYLVDTTAHDVDLASSWMIFGDFHRAWIAGGSFGDPSNTDQTTDVLQQYLRIRDTRRMFIGHNDFNYPGGCNSEFIKIYNLHHGRIAGHTSTNSVVIADNLADAGGDGCSESGGGYKLALNPQGRSSSTYNDEFVERVLVERNYFRAYNYSGDGSFRWDPFHTGSSKNIYFRNNIIDASTPLDSFTLVSPLHVEDTWLYDAENIYFYNNTIGAFSDALNCTVGIAYIDSGQVNIDVRNNLMYVQGSGMTKRIWTNSDPTVDTDNTIETSNPFFNGKSGMNPQDFKLSAQQSCTSLPTGVRRDFGGAIRTGCTKGAWDY